MMMTRLGASGHRGLGVCCDPDTPIPRHPDTPRQRRAGQATTEMLFILPLLLILAACAAYITYICWQGLKVQQAANLAARINGQERVGGAKDFNQIYLDNGLSNSMNTLTL